MQDNKLILYQCYTCNKQFPCKPSLDRHSLGHDLEEFASWTKVEHNSYVNNTQSSHVPPHKKLVLEPEGTEMNGNYNQGPVYIKPEVQQPESCAYHHHTNSQPTNTQPVQHQYQRDLNLAQKTAGSQHSSGPHDSSMGTIIHPTPDTTQKELTPSKVGSKGRSKKGNQPRRPRSPSQIKEKSFFCDQCDRAYTRRDHLNRHKLVHTGDRPFVCSVCLKSFIRKDKLQRHEKIHVKERQFDCQICGKGFGRKDGLNKHYMAHKMGTVGKQDKTETSQQATN